MSDELKPCPFCGSEAILEEEDAIVSGVFFRVSCINVDECPGLGPQTGKYARRIDARTAWNTRSPIAALGKGETG